MSDCLHQEVKRAVNPDPPGGRRSEHFADWWLCAECGREFLPDAAVAEIVTERQKEHDLEMKMVRTIYIDSLSELIRRFGGERSNQ